MTRDDLEQFLSRVGAGSLREFLGSPGRDEAIVALEQRVAWAVAHRNDPDQGAIGEFLVRNVDALKAVLDEGEDAWWERTATSGRVRKPAAGEWTEVDGFATPVVAPDRQATPLGSPDTTLDAPIPEVTRKTLRRGRYVADAPRTGSETLLPEADDTPGAPVRDLAPAATWVDEEPVDPDQTDPIGFVAVPLSATEKQRDERLAGTPAPAAPRESSQTLLWREVDEDDATDPRVVAGPPSLPPARAPTPPPPPVAPAPPPPARSWASPIALVLGTFALLTGLVVLLFVLYRLGTTHGDNLAHGGPEAAHPATAPVPAEPAPQPSPEPAPSAPPAPATTARPAPTAATPDATAERPRIPVPIQLRDAGFVPPAAAAEPEEARPAPPDEPEDALAGTTWVGTGGLGPIRLHVDGQAGEQIRGRFVRLVGGLEETTQVTGTIDEAGNLSVSGGAIALTGAIDGATARGTWRPDGNSRQWLMAQQ